VAIGSRELLWCGLGGAMIDAIFRLECAECDGRGLPSRLWIRTSVEVGARSKSGTLHYFECMNCGARLKSRLSDVVEPVDDEEWRRWVGDDAGSAGSDAPPAMPGGR